MEKKKLVLKKQVIAELSDKEKKEIIGGRHASGPGQATDIYQTCINCKTAEACDSEVCTLP